MTPYSPVAARSAATAAEFPAPSPHLSLAIPAGQARLRGPSPIREKLDHIGDRVRHHIRRQRSRSSTSSTSSNYENVVENWITNVGTTSLPAALVGGGEAFKTSYERSVSNGEQPDLPTPSSSSVAPTAPTPSASALSSTVRGRLMSADNGQASDRASTKSSSSTVVSYQTFHTAREFDPSSDSDGASVTSEASGTTAGPPAARMFLRQFSNFLAHGSPESNELFICERHQVADNDEDNHDAGIGSPNAQGLTAAEPQLAPPIKNVMTIAVYHSESDEPAVKMQALLDTGNMGENMMAARFANMTGHSIDPLPDDYLSPPVVGNGESLTALGFICVRWYFYDAARSTKSYDVRFLVVPDTVPFDVALGFDFLCEERIYLPSPLFAMTIYPSGKFFSGASTEAQRREQAERDRIRREREAQLRRDAERAARAREQAKRKK